MNYKYFLIIIIINFRQLLNLNRTQTSTYNKELQIFMTF